jgi:hypothetical protein
MLEKSPHACFKAEFPSAVSAKEEISRILTSHLFSRFGTVEAGLRWPWGPRTVELRLGQRLVWVGWYKRRRRRDGEWILFVGPGDWLPLWDYLRGRTPVMSTEEFLLVARDIHALLGSLSCVSNIRWYFRRFRREGKKSVRTPDELPWTEA